MLDNKGSFYIIDGVLAVILLLMVFLVINTAITIPTHDYSYETHDIRMAQDIMEVLSGKIDFADESFLGEISNILIENKNSKESVSQVCELSQNKLDSYNLKNFKFTENNLLDGKVLASNGDFKKARDVSVATRNYGDYSYTLFVW